MNVYIVNDTSGFHAGSWAVIHSLRHKLAADGHEVIHTTPRPLGPEREWIELCDAMVVNGEGAMQEEDEPWSTERVVGIMEGLRLAKELGKKAYLVNSVWYRMNPHWGDVLRSLDGVWVREPGSQRDMEQGQGFRPEVCIDLSYSCPLDDTAGSPEFAGKDVIGKLYKRNMPRDGRFSQRNWRFWGMKSLTLGGEAERKAESPSWTYLVKSLRGANVYATGQHHGLYAAALAQTPFAFFRVRNHKISALLEWAGVDIPIAGNRGEFMDAIEWAKTNRDEYDKLFAWLAQAPTWPGIGPA